jgi:light-regulated signal transduction histidine kinase (bacteriophytochrome)
MIDAMLTLSRVSRAEMNATMIDISALAQELVGKLGENEPGRSVDIEIEPGISARGDPGLIDALLTNLLSNALKYTSKVDKATIRLFRTVRNGKPCFCISDNGAGFDMARVAKLFHPFQRLHSAREFEGTGVGLATVQRIIHRHGGWIRAEAKVGKGAAFFFTLAQDEIKGDSA